MRDKIGIGIVAGKNSDAFNICIASVPEEVGTVHAVIDNTQGYTKSEYDSKINKLTTTQKKMGTACVKNSLLRSLIQEGCDHIFLIDEDHKILDRSIFEKYIKYAEETGIWHWNASGDSPVNKKEDGTPNVREMIEYGDGVEVAFYPACVSGFSYYLKNVIRNVGYMDERFSSLNSLEHIEHTYRIIKKGLAPPFWWFNDILHSDQLIQKQQFTVESSEEEHKEVEKNTQIAMGLFQHLHGNAPSKVGDTTPEEVLKTLDVLKNNYARKVL